MEEERTSFPTVVLGNRRTRCVVIDKNEYELVELKSIYILQEKQSEEK